MNLLHHRTERAVAKWLQVTGNNYGKHQCLWHLTVLLNITKYIEKTWTSWEYSWHFMKVTETSIFPEGSKGLDQVLFSIKVKQSNCIEITRTWTSEYLAYFINRDSRNWEKWLIDFATSFTWWMVKGSQRVTIDLFVTQNISKLLWFRYNSYFRKSFLFSWWNFCAILR